MDEKYIEELEPVIQTRSDRSGARKPSGDRGADQGESKG